MKAGLPTRWFWGVLLAVFFLTAWRFWLVGHSGISLFVDEAYYWSWSRELAWGYFSKPPGVGWLVYASNALFGTNVLGTKGLSMLLYPLTAGMIFLLGRDLYGPRVGAVAALVFISSFMVGLLGLFVSTDSLLLFFWASAAWCWWRGLHRARMAWWLAAGLALGLGLLSKYTMAAFAATALWTLWSNYHLAKVNTAPGAIHFADFGPRPAWQTAGPWLAALIALALFAPHIAWNLNHGSPTLRHTAEITTLAKQAGGAASLAEFWAGQLLLLGPLPLLVALAAAVQAGRWVWLRRSGAATGPNGAAPPEPAAAAGRLSPTAYLLALALPLLAVTTLQALRSRANINWGAPAYIAIALLFAAWVCGQLHLRAQRAGPARAVADGVASGSANGRASGLAHPRWLAATVALNLLLAVLVCHAKDLAALMGRELPAKADVFVRMRGWHEAFAALQPLALQHAQAQPKQARLPVLGVGRQLLAQATYEWRGLNVQPVAWNPQQRADDQYQLTTDLQAFKGRDVLLVLDHPPPAGMAERFERLELLGQTLQSVAPGRDVRLTLWRAQGFKGYSNHP
ncbi:MAG: ArnT family glycosyltransferase [Burkholderiaceae bacterium]